jgi:predicted HNH restriction endonuclease
MNKKIKKKTDKKCHFCEESDYNVLDVHRITPGAEGGKYSEFNTVCCCSNCHRKIHADEIKIVGKYYTTAGKYVINYIINGEEHWK